jgi:hypothetical protein
MYVPKKDLIGSYPKTKSASEWLHGSLDSDDESITIITTTTTTTSKDTPNNPTATAPVGVKKRKRKTGDSDFECSQSAQYDNALTLLKEKNDFLVRQLGLQRGLELRNHLDEESITLMKNGLAKVSYRKFRALLKSGGVEEAWMIMHDEKSVKLKGPEAIQRLLKEWGVDSQEDLTHLTRDEVEQLSSYLKLTRKKRFQELLMTE